MLTRLQRVSSLMQSKQHVLLMVSGVFCIGLLLALYFAIMNVKSDFKLTHKKVTPLAQVVSVDNKTQRLIAALPSAHLFGQKAEASDYIPITSLSLHLTGIIKVNEGISKAIISNAGKVGMVYGVGDKLPGGIRVHLIDKTGVVLENVGHLEKLPLLRPALTFQPLPPALIAKN